MRRERRQAIDEESTVSAGYDRGCKTHYRPAERSLRKKGQAWRYEREFPGQEGRGDAAYEQCQ